MIKGVYKFYLDGEYVGEQENSITVAGRAIILKSIMGLVPTVGGEIHFGIGNTANGDTDTNGLITRNILDFDIASSEVRLSYLDNSDSFDAMVFKTQLGGTGGSGEKYEIYEMGLFPGNSSSSQTSFRQNTLFSGASSDLWKEGTTDIVSRASGVTDSCYIDAATATANGYSFRVGNTALFLKSGDTLTVNGPFNGLGLYNSADKLAVAFSKLSAGTQTITMNFYSNSLNYYSAAISTSSGTTYGIGQKAFSEMTKTGLPSWDNISYITITANGDTVIDAVRFNDIDNLDTSYGMVSRAVLSTPIIKQANQVLDVEYYLSLAFNKTVA